MIVLHILCLLLLLVGQIEAFLVTVTTKPSYNKYQVPVEDDDHPLNITIDFLVEELSGVQETNQFITARLDIEVTWPDHRLIANITDIDADDANHQNNTWIPMADTNLWLPNLNILNVQEIKHVSMMRSTSSLLVNPFTKKLWYYMRILVTISCPMTFEDFPFDAHVCAFEFMPADRSIDVIELKPGVFANLSRPIPSVVQFTANLLPLTQEEVLHIPMGASNNFSVTGFKIHFQRKHFVYVAAVFAPCALFVSISWISFLVPVGSHSARLGMLITILLVLINIFMNVIYTAPVSGGINGLQLWILSCILFVALALVEYAIILWMKKREDATKLSPPKTAKPMQRPILDDFAIIVVPSLFIIFVIVYVVSVTEA